MKMTEYTEIEELDGSNILLVDGDNGTKKILFDNFLMSAMQLIAENADSATNALIAMKRLLFRGKYLGSSLTTEQIAYIQDGTFTDLWLGDYWTISGINYRIMDFDYWYNTGDTNCTDHHVIIVPDSSMYSAEMNSSNTTEGGYYGSEMYTTNLDTAKTTINSAFGSDYILSHREYLTNAVTSGYPSAGSWYDSTVELMNESMVYGHPHFLPAGDGSFVPNRYTIDKVQLAGFQRCPKLMNIRTTYWLRDVVSSTSFAHVNALGVASTYYASYSRGVRPVFAIG